MAPALSGSRLQSHHPSAPERFIKSDIIDKVLLRDFPQLYAIRDIQGWERPIEEIRQTKIMIMETPR